MYLTKKVSELDRLNRRFLDIDVDIDVEVGQRKREKKREIY